MDRSRVGIVIPALNESATIQGVIKAVGTHYVLIVVDDGSTDNTAELARQAGAIVVSHEQNCGYDVALNSGFKKAAELGCEVVITLDADGQHDPALLQQFIDQIDAGTDVVVGIRNKRPRFAEHLFGWYTSIRFGIEDPLCGMKAYRIAVLNALGYFDSYKSIGTELMIFAVQNGYRLGQVMFDVRDREGRSRFGRVIVGNYKIIRAMLLSIWRVKRSRTRHGA